MEIFGVGPLELLLIFLIMLIFLGPKEMVTGARKLAAWIKKLRQSEVFKTTQEIAQMPKEIMHETGLQDEVNKLRSLNKKQLNDVIRDTVIEVDHQTLEEKGATEPPPRAAESKNPSGDKP